jgi:spermidine synthase
VCYCFASTQLLNIYSESSSRIGWACRYHEALVHPAISTAHTANVRQAGLRILLLGAGDGLAAREVLKYGAAIDAVDLVDLDPFVTQL